MNPLARFKQYLFRWRSDGTAPLRLGQRRIFIVPSRAGLFFALALVVMLIGAINYNLALGHALVFLLVGYIIKDVRARLVALVMIAACCASVGPYATIRTRAMPDGDCGAG